MRLSVRIEHKVNDKYGRHKENDLSDVSSKHNAGVRTVIVTTIELVLMQIAQAKNAPQKVMHSPGLILQWISQIPKWLIIYDNADGDYSVVEKFLPPGEAGNILISSRNGELKRLAADSVNVLAMEEDEAVTLFLKSAML